MMKNIIIQNKILYPEILKKRPKDIHKKQCGQILVIAGSKGMTGVGVLVCRAAMRAGAGIVTLAFPQSLKEIYKDLLVEALTLSCPETKDITLSYKALDLLLEKSKNFDIIVIGPGLSKNFETQKLIQDLVAKLDKPILLDADGLNALQNKTDLFLKRKACPERSLSRVESRDRRNKTIITPHEGEMARLSGLSVKEIKKDRVGIARKFAEEKKVVVVLKGYETIIAKYGSELSPEASGLSSDNVIINKTGGPALATAGTGDVLCGIIASLWAENIKKPFKSACVGVYLHGLSGDLAKKELGERSVIASDVIEYLPEAIKKSYSE